MNASVIRAADRGLLVKYATAVAENARMLLADAEHLLSDGRWARAYSLAVLASEEWAKAQWIITLSFMSPVHRARINIREILEGHISKMMGAVLMSAVQAATPGVAERVAAMPDLAGLLMSAAQQAGQANLSKQRGFYADLLADGELSVPSDVTETEATEAVARARQVRESAGRLHDPDSLAAFAAIGDEAQEVLDAVFDEWAALSGIDSADDAAVAISDLARRAAALTAEPDS